MSASASTSALSTRADAFVTQLCQALIPKLSSSSSSSFSTTPASLRQHLHSVFRSLPSKGNDESAKLREYLLQAKVLDRQVARLAIMLEEGKIKMQGENKKEKKMKDEVDEEEDAANDGEVTLFSPNDYASVLMSIDEQLSSSTDSSTDSTFSRLHTLYSPILLPSKTPLFVHQHLVRTIIRTVLAHQQHAHAHHGKSKLPSLDITPILNLLHFGFFQNHSVESKLTYLESLVQLLRALPVTHGTLLQCTQIVNLCINPLCLSISKTTDLNIHRRYQTMISILLVQEAQRKSAAEWSEKDGMERYVGRVRTALRCMDGKRENVSLSGELLFLQHLLSSLQAYKLAEKAHRAAVVANHQHSKSASVSSKSGSKRTRSRSRSPATVRGSTAEVTTPDYHDIPLYHSPLFTTFFTTILSDIASVLSGGTRADLSEWIRFSLVIRSVTVQQESLLPQSFTDLKTRVQELANRMPSLSIPVTLKSTLVEAGLAHVGRVEEMWRVQMNTNSNANKSGVQKSTLEKLLYETEGDLSVREYVEIEQAEEEDDAEENEEEVEETTSSSSSSKRAKKSTSKAPLSKKQTAKNSVSEENFDSFGNQRQGGQSMFFIDTDVSGLAGSGAPQSENEEGKEEESVGRSMNKILAGLTQQQATQQPPSEEKKTKKEQQQAEENGNHEEDVEMKENEQAAMETEEEEVKKPASKKGKLAVATKVTLATPAADSTRGTRKRTTKKQFE